MLRTKASDWGCLIVGFKSVYLPYYSNMWKIDAIFMQLISGI